MSLRWQCTTASHIGGRDEQQDSVALFTDRGGASLLIVADGMGGHRGGALASQEIINVAQDIWSRGWRSAKLLQDICHIAHEQVNAIGKLKGIKPRSTCVLLYIKNNLACWTHVGDSRLYHFNAGQMQSRSADDSVVQMLFELGRIREDEMGNHVDQGKLLKSIGGSRMPDIEIHLQKLTKDDAFLLCSDGLWEEISTVEMSQSLTAPDLTHACNTMVNLAINRAGNESDNVAIAACRIK
ncbi:MAG: protein phosphatase 2C domain-containing protein [Mariprofundales bacterium]